MLKEKQRQLLGYAGSVAVMLLATGIRLSLDPILGTGLPFITYFPAIVIVAWFGGVGPSLVGLATSCVLIDVFVISPRGSLAIRGVENQVGFGVYILMGLLMALLSGTMQTARSRAGTGAIARWSRDRAVVGSGPGGIARWFC